MSVVWVVAPICETSSQLEIGSAFVSAIPWRSFGRKNVGYLYAVANGAEAIWDFDDDNMIKFWMEGAAVDENMWIDKFANLARGKCQTAN